MKKLIAAFALVGLMALGGQAFAVICTIDDVPAASLLLPYFEVDMDNPNGVNTLFSINNASATAILAHVVLWSDLSVEVFDFNIYLTGYDVQTISLRDILGAQTNPPSTGRVPRTASDAQDPTDTISHQGLFSQDVTFPSCAGQLPPPPIPDVLRDHIRAALSGRHSALFTPSCYGRYLGDNIARGYITVDTVNNCTLQAIGQANTPYFAAGGTGDATNQNVLWGDYFYVNSAQNFAQGETLVHIEASATDPETSVPGEYTFYGRYVNWTAADNREPLSTNFATRFVNGGTFSGGTDLLVWRDSKAVQGAFTSPGANCAVPDAEVPWYPLGEEGIVIFDEEENPTVPEQFPFSPPIQPDTLLPFPAEAQRTAVDGTALPVDPDFGWLYLNLNTTVTVAGANPPEDPAAAQAWVTTVMDAEGRFSVGYDAIQLDSACNAVHFIPGSIPQ